MLRGQECLHSRFDRAGVETGRGGQILGGGAALEPQGSQYGQLIGCGRHS